MTAIPQISGDFTEYSQITKRQLYGATVQHEQDSGRSHSGLSRQRYHHLNGVQDQFIPQISGDVTENCGNDDREERESWAP